jgi:polyphosphate kinase
MPRNLDRRVEAMVPILDRALHPRLEAVLNVFLSDNRQAWDLAADGTWTQRRAGDEAEHASHKRLLRESWGMPRTSGAGREVPAVVAAG